MPHRPDALCSSVMSEPPVVLKPSDSILSALQSIIEHRVPSLPVVDADGRYLGMLPRSRLIALAMPHVLSDEHEKFSPRHACEMLRRGLARRLEHKRNTGKWSVRSEQGTAGSMMDFRSVRSSRPKA